MIRLGTLDWGIAERKAIEELISGDNPILTMGLNVRKFESQFAKWIGCQYGVAVNSGTSAVITALNALKIKYECKDIWTTSLVYPAAWNAIQISQLTPRYVDINSETLNMDPSKIGGPFVLGVHLFGKPLRMDLRNDLIQVEDAAQALGSKIGNKRVGSFGAMGCFSFYVAHQITTIEGGMVTTNDKELADISRMLRDNGRICNCPICTLKTKGICPKRLTYDGERRWATDYVGFNLKPTEFQGVLGLVKMKKINKIVERRHQILQMYNDDLESLSLLKEESNEYICPLAYPIYVKHPMEVVNKLAKDNIECRGMFPARGDCPNAKHISKNSIMVPAHQNLTDEEVHYIIEKIKEAVT